MWELWLRNSMKYMFFTVLAMFSTTADFAMDSKTIEMPSAHVLHERLKEIGFEYFAAKTFIINDTAKKLFSLECVVGSIEDAYYDFNEYLMKRASKQDYDELIDQADTDQWRLLRALLQDEPAALEELEKDGVYRPIKKIRNQ